MRFFALALLLSLLFLGCCYAAGQYLYGGYGIDTQLEYMREQEKEILHRLTPGRRS